MTVGWLWELSGRGCSEPNIFSVTGRKRNEFFLLNICKIFLYFLVIIVGKQSFVFHLAGIKGFEETVT